MSELLIGNDYDNVVRRQKFVRRKLELSNIAHRVLACVVEDIKSLQISELASADVGPIPDCRAHHVQAPITIFQVTS